MNKAVIAIVLGSLMLAGGIYYSFKQKPGGTFSNNKVTIEEKWELPEILMEISGIAYMENNTIACVQDEDGIIFIYDLKSSKIIKEIEFAGPGDYEAITLVGTTAYVLKSDGTLYEIMDFEDEKSDTREYTSKLNSQYDFEGLGFDEKNNQLLLSIKDKSENDYNPIFSFDLETKKISEEPEYKINFKDSVFDILNQKVSRKMLRPSEITLHPDSGEFYILEGVDPKLLILNTGGEPERIYKLNKEEFPQAEGLTFGRKGELYISNEGNGAAPNILRISFE